MGAKRGNAPGRLRIIGGEWRGRQLDVLTAPGLRPTPDRVRETLFNWLQWSLPDARCLDLFGGTGALGLEAASRGAGEVIIVEKDAKLARAIESNVAVLGGGGKVQVQCADALTFLADARPFDLVFLDPPYHRNLLSPCMAAIASGRLLADQGSLYFEHAADEPTPELAPAWRLKHRKQAGQVVYGLCLCCSAV